MTAVQMSLGDAPHVSSHARLLTRRAGALAAFLGVPFGMGLASTVPSLQPAVHWLCSYSPARLVHGEVWTLPFSALFAAKPHAIGRTTLLPFLVLGPFVMICGAWRPVRSFFAGHIVATLAAAVMIIGGASLGWHEGHVLYHAVDKGVSAGVAGAGGAFAVVVARSRWRPVAIVIVGTLVTLFTVAIFMEGPSHVLADSEHLVALATGALIEWRWSRAEFAADRNS